MSIRSAQAFRLAGVFLACSVLGSAQEWKGATSLPGVDFAGLSPKAKATVLKVLRDHECSCQCGRKLAQCRVEDPGCAYSTNLAKTAIAAAKSGSTESEIDAAINQSNWAHLQTEQPQARPMLAPAVQIPVAGSPVLGDSTAKVTMVEFSDFQCPYCAQAVSEIDAVLKAYPSQIKLIFKQFPLEMHPQAEFAAKAALAAQKQGKFWEMHNAMFAHQNQLSREGIESMAQAAGLDMKKFDADLASTEVSETVIRDVQDGDRVGVEGTPSFFINGQKYNGYLDLNHIKPIIDNELKSTTGSSR